MPILQIGFLIALIAGLEGANILSGGDMYLASLRLLTQDTGGTVSVSPPPPPPQEVSPPPPPPPPPPPQETPPPPPPPSPQHPTSSYESTSSMPPMPAASEGHKPPMMPPPENNEPPRMPPPPPMPHEGFQMMPHPSNYGPRDNRMMMPPPPGERPGMRPGEMRYEPSEGKKMMPPMPYENNQMRGMPSKRTPMPSMNNPFRQFERMGGEEMDGEFREDGDSDEEGNLDPRVVSQVLSEMKRMLGDIKRLKSQLKKSGSNGTLVSELDEIGTDLNRFAGILSGGADSDAKREAIDEFRDGEYHERLNSLRAKIEVPQEIKRISQSIKRLEKVLGTKSIKALGLNLGKVTADITEMKAYLTSAQESLNNGDYDEAKAQLGEFHEDVNPSQIESALFAIRDAKNSLKRIRDVDLKQKIQEALIDAIDAFNNGEYDGVREAFNGIR